MNKNDLTRIEIELLIDAIKKRYGYDFSHYAQSSFRRRVENRLNALGLNTISDLIPRLMHDELFFEDVLVGFSITVTEMFRDPKFYRDIRTIVIPKLKTYPYLKIWHAGCATGEEIYSMAILLHEEGLLEQTQIYATDFNNTALKTAERGIYPLDDMENHAKNYYEAGGAKEFSEYYRTQYKSAKLKGFLKEKITFANHNLVTDGVFGEMHMIICRNVMIYFDKNLQDRAYSLFVESLIHRGFLCLGTKDTVAFSIVSENFEILAKRNKIFRLLPNAKLRNRIGEKHA